MISRRQRSWSVKGRVKSPSSESSVSVAGEFESIAIDSDIFVAVSIAML